MRSPKTISILELNYFMDYISTLLKNISVNLRNDYK